MKLSDFRGVLKKTSAVIQSINHVEEDYYIIQMKAQAGVSWRPGEHGIFSIPSRPIKGKAWRAFSIASTPEEGIMMIATRTGDQISTFKKELLSLKPGDEIQVRGPFGWFTVQDETSPIVLVAGGVGITPVRAVLKSLETYSNRPIDLVYSAKGYHLFEGDLRHIAETNDKVNLHIVSSSQETQDKVTQLAAIHGGKGLYYISGSTGFIKGIKHLLKGKGIASKRMINDPFLGY